MAGHSLALCGAAGGVGTTRITLETANVIAKNGYDVVVLDAAFGTQGLARYVPGTIVPDMTDRCLSDEPLMDAFIELPVSNGRLAICPAHAPFERLARAKTPVASIRFEDRIAEAMEQFDFVLIDTPPVDDNQAIAVVTTVNQTILLCDAGRAHAAIPLMKDRIDDLSGTIECVWITDATSHSEGEHCLPWTASPFPATDSDWQFVTALSPALDSILPVDITIDSNRGLVDQIRTQVQRLKLAGNRLS